MFDFLSSIILNKHRLNEISKKSQKQYILATFQT